MISYIQTILRMKSRSEKILVVGETCDDVFVYGEALRLCPDVPAPVFKAFRKVCSQGMAGNTKSNLEALGHTVDIFNQQTKITKTRFVDDKLNYTFLRVDDGESNDVDNISPSLITNKEISEYKAIVISDYGKGFLDHSHIQRFCNHNPNTFVDTKKEISPSWAWCVGFVKINYPEFKAIEESINKHKDQLIRKLIVTRGSDGCDLLTEEGFKNFPVAKVDVFDLSGAGDSFLAALVSEYLISENIERSIKYANYKASEVIQKKGVGTISK